jgi:hypothetical protein
MRLRAEPAILERARARLEEWIARGGRSVSLLLRWRDVLSRSPAEVAEVLTDRSEDAAWLRSASPFAGALDPHTRLAILRQVRQRHKNERIRVSTKRMMSIHDETLRKLAK